MSNRLANNCCIWSNWNRSGPCPAGGMFKLKEYSVHANPMPMKNAVALLDILDCMSFVRTALRGEPPRVSA